MRGAQGLDALEDEGGAVQGLPITGVLEWTAVTGGRRKRQKSSVKDLRQTLRTCVSVMSHRPTESQGSEVMSSVGGAEFHGSLGRRGSPDEGPKMSTRSSMADYRGRQNRSVNLCQTCTG